MSALRATGAADQKAAARPAVDLRPIDLYLVDQDVAARLVPPPADALDGDQRARLAAEEPLSLLRVLGPEGEDGAAAGVSAGILLRELRAAGHYHHRGEVFAIHGLVSPVHQQIGLIAGVPLSDVREGLVRPHEQTREYREARLAEFLAAAGADVSPVVLTHPPVPELDRLVATTIERPPDLAFDGWGHLRHRVWIIDEPSVQAGMRRAARSIAQLTIVDGHHRVAAALRAGRPAEGQRADGRCTEPPLLAELIADRDLRMVGFDRRVHVESAADADALLDRLAEVAALEELGEVAPPRPTGALELVAGRPGRWIRATFVDVPPEVPDSLPVTLLQERILGPILGIGDPRTDRRLEHLPGVGDLDELDRSLRVSPTLAFVPRAVTVTELQEVARRGRTLPPKSTYVDPKPGPGVVLRLRDRSERPVTGAIDP